MSVDDPYDLQRFVAAQAAVYPEVLAELGAGEKRSHWMWFIFPQLAGLGRSATARRYALSSLAEARAYLAHPLLGARLRECTQLVNEVTGRSAAQIFGFPDELKFHSCMTLFAHAAGQRTLPSGTPSRATCGRGGPPHPCAARRVAHLGLRNLRMN
jgi:uncharacterized protein (DUF1810 family)